MKRILLCLLLTVAAAAATGAESNAPPAAASNAVAQVFCPVMTDRKINERFFVDYQGSRIYVCCVPCRKAVAKDPAKYIKMLQDQGITPAPTPPDPRGNTPAGTNSASPSS